MLDLMGVSCRVFFVLPSLPSSPFLEFWPCTVLSNSCKHYFWHEGNFRQLIQMRRCSSDAALNTGLAPTEHFDGLSSFSCRTQLSCLQLQCKTLCGIQGAYWATGRRVKVRKLRSASGNHSIGRNIPFEHNRFAPSGCKASLTWLNEVKHQKS